ncbi:anti-sigma factor family protein [Ramlibacter sp.]|uniref:anti-sigma factor family protein n=1 Tax=Ramlibacter sp. TaxID=1917967 RepID=UPI0039C8D7D6
MKDSTFPMSEDPELHAYVDGRLDPLQNAAVEARLGADAALARQIHAWKAQRLALRDLHAEVLEQPVPAHLLHAAQLLDRRSSRFSQWSRWGGMAASVLLAFALGWAGHLQWQERTTTVATGAHATGQFVRQAALAYTVYVPEVRHPVEVEAAQQQHLVQWLSKRLERPLKLPTLQPSGYELVGGRLLPGDSGARAQFMYQNANGERVTLYVGAVDGAAGKGMGETAFRFANEGGVASFYWVENGFGYAITGKLPRPAMLVLAEAVYRQL